MIPNFFYRALFLKKETFQFSYSDSASSPAPPAILAPVRRAGRASWLTLSSKTIVCFFSKKSARWKSLESSSHVFTALLNMAMSLFILGQFFLGSPVGQDSREQENWNHLSVSPLLSWIWRCLHLFWDISLGLRVIQDRRVVQTGMHYKKHPVLGDPEDEMCSRLTIKILVKSDFSSDLTPFIPLLGGGRLSPKWGQGAQDRRGGGGGHSQRDINYLVSC